VDDPETQLALPQPVPPTTVTPDNGGYIPVRRRVRPSFASITQAGIAQNDAASKKSKAAASAQSRTPTGRPKPIMAATAKLSTPLTTDVVIARYGGFPVLATENALRARHAGDIVRGIQREIKHSTRTPITVLRGRWSRTVENSGNFILTIVRNHTLAFLTSFCKWLCEPFSDDCNLVPCEGWVWAQLREVIAQDDDGQVWELAVLTQELRQNPVFTSATFGASPHWMHSLVNLQTRSHGMVLFAYEDVDSSLTQNALEQGVAMFGYQVKFVPVGDKPRLIQCGQCHELGHFDGDPICKIAYNQLWCVRCGGAHSHDDHAFNCPRAASHCVADLCKCVFPCLLCGKPGHNAQNSRNKCAKHGDHPPPSLLRLGTNRSPDAVLALAPPPRPAQAPAPPKGKKVPKPRAPAAKADRPIPPTGTMG
jgi:hypothetical protein